MKLRTPIVLAAVVSLLVPAFTMTAAGAATPTVTVTPATDLVDGQVVHVAVAGLAPGESAYSTLCRAGSAPEDGVCARTTASGIADEAGAVGFDLAVEAQFLTWEGAEVECRVAPGCILLTAMTTAEGSRVETPLGFRPDGPLLPPPTVTVTPSDDLVDGSGAHVTGTGFIGGSTVVLVQCRSPFTGNEDCEGPQTYATADPLGSIALDFDLVAVLFANDGTEVDCRVVPCELVATLDLFNLDLRRTASAPLAFRPDGPLLPPPVLTVEPADELVDGQELRVSGSGFRSGPLLIAQCFGTPGTLYDRCSDSQFTTVDQSHAFTVVLTAKVVFGILSGYVDCRTAGCTIAAFDINSGRQLADAPIRFDPNGPTPTPPTLTVAPGGPLAARSPVIVTGQGFEPFTQVSFQRCRLVAGIPDGCTGFGGDVVQTDANGSLLAGMVVTAVVGGNDGTETDCRVVTCGLVADSFSGLPAIAPLQFQPSTTRPTRYLAPVFDDVDVTSDIVYRQTTNSRGEAVDLALDVYRPAGDTVTKRPAVMWMFGGYFGSGAKGQLRDHAMAMARRGYVSVAIDYRTRPEIFSNGPGCVPVGGACLDPTQLGPAITDARDDARAAMVWLHDHATEYGIEPRAISAAGWSAGAITALNLAHDATGDRPAASIPAAAVSLAGILTAEPGTDDPPSMMMGGNHDSLLALNAQIAGCGVIETAGSDCEFVAYAGLRPAPASDECVRLAVPCTYVTGRDGEHGFLFEELPDVIERMSIFLARTVLEPAGLLPRRDPGHHPHHRPPRWRHHHHHRHDRHHHHDGHHDGHGHHDCRDRRNQGRF